MRVLTGVALVDRASNTLWTPTYFLGFGGLGRFRRPVGNVAGFSEPAFATPDAACSVKTAGALYAAFLRKSLLFGSCFFAMNPSAPVT